MQYNIHDITFQVRSEDPRIGLVIRDTLRYFGFLESSKTSSKPIISLTITVSEPLPSVPPDACEATQFNNRLTAWRAGKRIYLSDAHSWAQLETASGTGIGTISPLLLDHPHTLHWTVYGLLIFSLLILLHYRNLFSMHAAALVRKGRGVLFVAASGCGKSTMAYSLVRQGWQYLSDDLILLRAGDAHVEAFSFRKVFALNREAQELFPELTSIAETQPGDDEKVYLSMDLLYPSQEHNRCVPKVLIFPEIVDASRSQFVSIGKAEAMRYLLEQSGLLMLEPNLVPGHMALLGRLLAQTQHYRLMAGRDLKKEPLLIGSILENILSNVPSDGLSPIAD